MSEDAIGRLLEHLKNIKLQHAEEVFAYHSKLTEMQHELSKGKEREERLLDQLELRQEQVEEMRRLQKTKHRIETLDDWKIMCDQLKKDRTRLEVEVDTLRAERVRLLSELAKAKKERVIGESHVVINGAGLPDGYNGGAAAASASSSVPMNEHDLRLELERLKRHTETLESEKRISEGELRRLRQEIHDVLQAYGHEKGGSGGMNLLYSIVQGLLGGRKERAPFPSNNPVLQV